MSSIGEKVGTAKKESNTFQDSATGTGDIVALGGYSAFDITPETRTLIVKKKEYDTNTTYGQAEYGTGEMAVGYSFILGHPSRGILGTSIIGDGGLIEETSIRVINYNNSFEDYFETNTFIDLSNSTGTGDFTINYNYNLASGEKLQSEIIAANNTLYTKATLIVTGSGLDDDTLYLSGDGGTTWEVVTNGVQHTFTNNSTDGIKYKVIGGATTSTIENIKVNYQ